MLATKTAAGAGPINALLAVGRDTSRFLNIASCRKNVVSPTLGTQPTDVTAKARFAAWSVNAGFLVVQHSNGIRFLKRTGYTFSGSDATSGPTGDGSCGISADGSFVAAQTRTSPFARIWHNNNGTLTTLSNIGTVAAGNSVALTSDGSFAAFLREASPFLQIKKRSGNGNTSVFADITVSTQPATGSTISTGYVAFSPDNQFLAVLNRSGGLTFYKFNPSTQLFDSLSVTISGTAPSAGNGLAWSADGEWLATASTSATILYKISIDLAISSIITFSNLPVGSGLTGSYIISSTPSSNSFFMSDISGNPIAISNSWVTPGVSKVVSNSREYTITSLVDGLITITGGTTTPTLTSQTSLSGGYAGSFHPLGTQYITGTGVIYKKSTDTSWPLARSLATAPYSLTNARAATFSPLITS
jgi:hypothetical protein